MDRREGVAIEFDGLLFITINAKSLRLLIRSYMGMKRKVRSREWPRVRNGSLLRFRHRVAGKGVSTWIGQVGVKVQPQLPAVCAISQPL